MKRIFLTIIISALTIVTFAQSQNITSSAIIFKQYNSEKDKVKKEAKIIEAKDYIDLAYENASTSNDPKMWMYRAQIYKIIAFNYSNLDSKAIFKATESHAQCMKPHPKKKNKIVIYKKWPVQEVFNGLMQCANKLFNLAVESYKEGKYQESLDYYKPIHGVIDLDKEGQLKSIQITAESVIHNSYLCAKAMKNNDLSKDYLQKLMDMNSTNPSIYSSMSAIYMDEGNSDKALEYLALGREMFEMDQGLVNTEINLYIQLGRTSELIGILGEALELDPENDLLLFNRGTIYDQQGDFINAEADYKASLAINPFAFGTNYNLGALYFNTAIEQNNKANATSNNSTHKKLKSKADALFAKALPFLKTAYLIDSKDKNTLLSLKQLYYMNGDYAKSSEMKKIIEGLK